jgi:S1-C subfamily serine protease
MSTNRFKLRFAGWMATAAFLAFTSAYARPALTLACVFNAQAKTVQQDSREQSSNKGSRLTPDARIRVRKAIAAVGLILVRNFGDNSAPRPRGSGVVIRSDGIIATNNHVITDRRSNSVYDEIFFTTSADGGDLQRAKASRLKTVLVDADYDLALLRVEPESAGNAATKPRPLPVIEMGDSKNAQLLDELVVIGFPEKGGATVTLSEGIIEGKDILGNWIKTDARVIHGNSGGAAVNSEGKLIGIPTKVEADDQEIDNNGDGFPDSKRRYGAVGFLRPSHLLAAMIEQLDNQPARLRSNMTPKSLTARAVVSIKGVVRSLNSGKPIAGALIGLVPLGTVAVTEANLLAWGTSSSEGVYTLNKPVPPGKYTLKAKALGHAAYSRDIEINQSASELLVEMTAAPAR